MRNFTPQTLTSAQEKLPARLFYAAMLLIIAGAAYCDLITAWKPAMVFAVCLAVGQCWHEIRNFMRTMALMTALAFFAKSAQVYTLLHADPADGEAFVMPYSIVWIFGLLLAMLFAASFQRRSYRQINHAWKWMAAGILLTLTGTIWANGFPAIGGAAYVAILTGFITLLPEFMRRSDSDGERARVIGEGETMNSIHGGFHVTAGEDYCGISFKDDGGHDGHTLKLCPFCGSSELAICNTDLPVYRVECQTCGASCPGESEDEDDCISENLALKFHKRALLSAVASWNRRH